MTTRRFTGPVEGCRGCREPVTGRWWGLVGKGRGKGDRQGSVEGGREVKGWRGKRRGRGEEEGEPCKVGRGEGDQGQRGQAGSHEGQPVSQSIHRPRNKISLVRLRLATVSSSSLPARREPCLKLSADTPCASLLPLPSCPSHAGAHAPASLLPVPCHKLPASFFLPSNAPSASPKLLLRLLLSTHLTTPLSPFTVHYRSVSCRELPTSPSSCPSCAPSASPTLLLRLFLCPLTLTTPLSPLTTLPPCLLS